MSKDRSADRHARNPVCARLDEDDDRWFRAHAAQAGMKTHQAVIAAVKAWRKQIENDTAQTPGEPQ